MNNKVRDIVIEYIGYGLYDARLSDFDTRGVGNSKMDALIDLLENIKQDEKLSSLECSINIAV